MQVLFLFVTARSLYYGRRKHRDQFTRIGLLLLDTTHDIATPEGVELRLPVAGLASRSLAWLVDAMIKIVTLMLGIVILEFLGDFGDGLILIGIFLLLWFYNVLFEVFNHGATPGKRALGIRVMNANGTPVGWTGSMIRNLIRAVDALPGCYAFGCMSVLLSRDFQRLGDLAAGTIVVYSHSDAAGASFADVEPLAVKVPLTLDEQQAIVSFGERAPRLTRDRAEELAELMAPVFGEVSADQLRSYAAWLAGSEGRQ